MLIAILPENVVRQKTRGWIRARVEGVGAFLADDFQVRLPDVLADEDDLRGNFFIVWLFRRCFAPSFAAYFRCGRGCCSSVGGRL